MTIYIQLKTLTIQVIPEKDMCYIFSSGRPIWCGNKDELISLLEDVNKES